ncbi:MAG: hypothetical protein HY512_03850 [Candidatus Aenigmarchaeota archaeon]|nr:hypothetical protein [Candidatus Aenigmarchaeota archaeon]
MIRDLVLTLFITGILFYAFYPLMLSLGGLTFISFLLACALSFYRGVVFEDPRVIGFIAIGHVLTNVAVNSVLPLAFESILTGSILQASIIVVVFSVIYLKGKDIQSIS